MKISLMKKLSIIFTLVVLSAIILTSIISNLTVGQKFRDYLTDEQKTKLNNAIEIINNSFTVNDNNTKINIDEIERYATMQQLYIEIKDLDNNTIYSSQTSHLKYRSQKRSMKGFMMRSFSEEDLGKYIENKYSLTSDGKKLGTIIIGYFGSPSLSSDSLIFINTLNHSFILSAIVALILGLIVSIIISKQFSKPLVKITQTANKMRDGDLEVRSEVKTNTKEIVDLSNSINYLADTLKKQESLRKKLTSDMAHELRTPLTTLKTHVEAFMDGVFEPNKERLEIFYEEIERLIKMINNLRNLAKLEETNLNLNKSKVNISDELNKIIENFMPLYKKKNYELYSRISPNIHALVDKDKFTQIMNNIILNSYKYLKPMGEVTVSLNSDNKNIIIKVIDTGIGISKKDIPYIFERFYRSDASRSKNTGGSGIGLTITKAFVLAHGGKIYVNSELDVGSIFTVELPKNL